jgi:hypothetical protein
MQVNGTSTVHKPSYVLPSEKKGSFRHVVDLRPFIRKWNLLAKDRG